MKTALLILIAAVFAAAGASAQSVAGFQLGVKGGFNSSGYLGKDSESQHWENRHGMHIGAFVSIPVTAKTFQIQPELLYSQKGAKHFTEFTAGNDENDFTVRQHHLDIPIMGIIRARFFYFEIGPALSILLKADADPAFEELTDEFNRFGIGAAAGAGIMTEHGLMAGLRYQGDFNRLVDDTGDEPNFHNSVFQIYVGWLFGGRPGAELSTEKDDYQGG